MRIQIIHYFSQHALCAINRKSVFVSHHASCAINRKSVFVFQHALCDIDGKSILFTSKPVTQNR